MVIFPSLRQLLHCGTARKWTWGAVRCIELRQIRDWYIGKMLQQTMNASYNKSFFQICSGWHVNVWSTIPITSQTNVYQLLYTQHISMSSGAYNSVALQNVWRVAFSKIGVRGYPLKNLSALIYLSTALWSSIVLIFPIFFLKILFCFFGEGCNCIFCDTPGSGMTCNCGPAPQISHKANP